MTVAASVDGYPMNTGAPLPPDQPSGVGSPVQADVPHTTGRTRRTAVRSAQACLLATMVAIALLGAVVTPLMGMLVFAPCLGALVGGVVALLHSDFPHEPSSRRAFVYAVATGTMLIPFANGLVGLGSAGGVVLFALLVLGPLLAADRMAAEMGEAAGSDVEALSALLPVLRTAQLLAEWEATENLLSSPRHHAVAAEIRALLLDELSRRDPAGVAAWLAAGRASPQRYIRADHGLAG